MVKQASHRPLEPGLKVRVLPLQPFPSRRFCADDLHTLKPKVAAIVAVKDSQEGEGETDERDEDLLRELEPSLG